jgi:hypothetical protein
MIVSATKKTDNPYPKFFKCYEVRSTRELSEIVVSSVWSPICWKNNERKSEDFYCSDFLVLDFDDGSMTLEQAITWAKKYRHIIGTTKSHQKPKSDMPACDRFRIIIPWEKRIECKATYTQNMARILKQMSADQSCKDAARIYQPCLSIVSVGNGEPAKWFPYEPPPLPKRNPYYENTKTIPIWLQELMTTPPPNGARNKTAYKIAYYLASYGFSEDECKSAVFSAPIDLPEREKITCALSGYKNGIKKSPVN